MSAIAHALNYVKQTIPPEILQVAFMGHLSQPMRMRQMIPLSLDHMIRSKVIEDRVLPDVNLFGGTEIWLPIFGLAYEMVNTNTYVYRIPLEMTQGRKITRMFSTCFTNLTGVNGYVSAQGKGSLISAAMQVMSSASNPPIVSNAYVELVGDNTIVIESSITSPAQMVLRCWIEGDANMTHLKTPVYLLFSKIVAAAVRNYIHVNTVIPQDISFIHGGMELGRMKESIESYSGANEEYLDFLETKWGKVSIFNSPVSRQRHIQSHVGGGY